jgi:antitoxin CptB
MLREDFEKLRWRCVRRGLLEVDISLTRFLDEQFEGLTDEEQLAFVELADMEDYDLWASNQWPGENVLILVLTSIVEMLRKS